MSTTRAPKRAPITTDRSGKHSLHDALLRSGEALDVQWPDGSTEVVTLFLHGGTPAAEGSYHGAFAIVSLKLPGVTARRTPKRPSTKGAVPHAHDGKRPSRDASEDGHTRKGDPYTIRSDGRSVTVLVGGTPVASFGPDKHDLLEWLTFVGDVFRTRGVHVGESHMPTGVWRATSGTPLSKGVR